MRSQYLDDLSSNIGVYTLAVGTTKEHLEIPPISVDRLSLSLLPPPRQISLADPVQERHHHSFVAFLWLECRAPFPSPELVAAAVSRQLS